MGAHESIRPLYESSHGWWTRRDDSSFVLRLINKRLLKVKELVTLKLSFWKAKEAYERLIDSRDRTLGIILDWKNAQKRLDVGKRSLPDL